MISSGGMTARIDRLAAAGLVRRRPNPDDRRGAFVELIEKGRAMIDTAVVARLDYEAAVVGALERRELETLGALLAKRPSSLQAMTTEGADASPVASRRTAARGARSRR